MRILAVATVLAVAAAGPALALTLSSGDLTPGKAILAAHIYPRCGGQNLSPDLRWTGAPAATKSLVLTVIDMDVKPALWSHWVVVDLPPSTTGLARGTKALPAGAHAVASNFGEAAYDGPCPPPGSGLHHYRFTIWAMPAAATAIAPDQHADTVIAKLSATALAKAELTGSVAAKP
jgi:Raf kinase inhibitor-like YbhB/YbcL family protein